MVEAMEDHANEYREGENGDGKLLAILAALQLFTTDASDTCREVSRGFMNASEGSG